MYAGNYKWSYDPRNKTLRVWTVDSSRSYASPSHHDVTGPDGLISCSQGRLVVEDGKARAVIYATRPYDPTCKDRIRIQDTAKQELEDEIEMEIVWRVEE